MIHLQFTVLLEDAALLDYRPLAALSPMLSM
jgi:hypothetical protein